MASLLHKELEYKVEKLKYEKVEGHAARDQKSNPKFQLLNINHPGSVHTKFYSCD